MYYWNIESNLCNVEKKSLLPYSVLTAFPPCPSFYDACNCSFSISLAQIVIIRDFCCKLPKPLSPLISCYLSTLCSTSQIIKSTSYSIKRHNQMAAKPHVKNKHLWGADSVFQLSGSQFFIRPLGGVSLSKKTKTLGGLPTMRNWLFRCARKFPVIHYGCNSLHVKLYSSPLIIANKYKCN